MHIYTIDSNKKIKYRRNSYLIANEHIKYPIDSNKNKQVQIIIIQVQTLTLEMINLAPYVQTDNEKRKKT